MALRRPKKGVEVASIDSLAQHAATPTSHRGRPAVVEDQWGVKTAKPNALCVDSCVSGRKGVPQGEFPVLANEMALGLDSRSTPAGTLSRAEVSGLSWGTRWLVCCGVAREPCPRPVWVLNRAPSQHPAGQENRSSVKLETPHSPRCNNCKDLEWKCWR